MISRSREAAEADPAWPIWVVACVYALFAMTDLRDLFALPWMIGRSDVSSWWVTGGNWALWGGVALFIGAVITTGVYSHMRHPTGRVWVTLSFSIVSLACLTLAGRGRVEVRADDLRVVWEDWGRAEAIYRVEHSSRLTVACESGRKNKIYPAFDVDFADGSYMDLTPLLTRRGNPYGSRAGLQIAERLDVFLSARGNRYLWSPTALDERCVRRMTGRLGSSDVPRLARLFRY